MSNTSRPSRASKVTLTSARVRAAKNSVKKPKREVLPPARLIFVADKSSSMTSMRDQVISGFNEFLKGQQDLPGEATFSLITFSSDVYAVYDRADLRKIPQLDYSTYCPDGMTALYDAIGFTIDRYKESRVGEKTIMAIMTDGQENASRTYSLSLVKQKILQAQESSWEILFLGANLDSQEFAKTAGIKLNNVTDYTYTSKGLSDAYTTATMAASAYRGMSLNVGGQLMNANNFNATALYTAVDQGSAKSGDVLLNTIPAPDASAPAVISPSVTITVAGSDETMYVNPTTGEVTQAPPAPKKRAKKTKQASSTSR